MSGRWLDCSRTNNAGLDGCLSPKYYPATKRENSRFDLCLRSMGQDCQSHNTDWNHQHGAANGELCKTESAEHLIEWACYPPPHSTRMRRASLRDNRFGQFSSRAARIGSRGFQASATLPSGLFCAWEELLSLNSFVKSYRMKGPAFVRA